MKEIKYILNKLVWAAYVSLWWAVFVFDLSIYDSDTAQKFFGLYDSMHYGWAVLSVWTVVGIGLAVTYLERHWNDK